MAAKRSKDTKLDDGHKTKNANKQIRGKKSVHMNKVTDAVTKKRKQTDDSKKNDCFVGIDLHKKFMQVALMEADGTLLQNTRIECDYTIIKKEFSKFPKNTKYVIESSSVWYGMYRFLRDELNLNVVLSNPHTTKVIASSKKKTDKVDARILADLLRCGYIVESYVPEHDVIESRQLVRCRSAIVKGRTRNKNLIHGILLQNGTKIGGVPFTADFIKKLHDLNDWRIELYLDATMTDNKNILDCDMRVQQAVANNHEARLLKTMPGIGNYIALTLAAGIGDISRFADADKLASYFGIVPSVRNSAEKVQHGRITRTGDSHVRQMLAEAALVHVNWARKNKKATPIYTFYTRLAEKRGASKAKVAAAAKMIRIIFWMLKKDIGFWTCVEEGKKSTHRELKKKQTRKGKK